jgi:hypothetical protein
VQQQQLQDEYVPGERAGTRSQDQQTNDKQRTEGTRYLFEVLEMKTNKPTTEFWTVLSMVNVLALIYPIRFMLRADSADENLFATCLLVGFLFLLVVVDAVSIVVAEAVGTGKR